MQPSVAYNTERRERHKFLELSDMAGTSSREGMWVRVKQWEDYGRRTTGGEGERSYYACTIRNTAHCTAISCPYKQWMRKLDPGSKGESATSQQHTKWLVLGLFIL